jgi:hypothetical protein
MDSNVAELFHQAAADGWRVQVPADILLDYLGIQDPNDRAWMSQRFLPQPLRTFEQAYRRRSGAIQRIPKTYIHCTQPSSGPAYDRAARKAQESGWRFHSLPTAHEAMWTMPTELAAILNGLKAGSSSCAGKLASS